MSIPTLCIVYEGRSIRPLSIAKVHDRALLVQAAEAAVREAELRAVNEQDNGLAAIHHEEASRLRRTLGLFLPELDLSTHEHAEALM